MERVFVKAISLILTVLCSTAFARISIVQPKDGDWLPFADDEISFEVSGKVEGISAGSELVLSFDGKEGSKTKIGKDGSFSFRYTPDQVGFYNRTQLTVSAVGKNGKQSESVSQYIYCCSRDNFGFYDRLDSSKPYEIKITKKNTDIDGMVVKVPAGVTVGKDSYILVYKAPGQGISLKKYIPLSVPIGVVVSSVKSRVGLQFEMKLDRKTPRDDTGSVITPDDYQQITDREWKDVDLKKAKIVILASDFSGSEWSEIPVGSISGDTVTFKQSEKNKNFTVFVAAALVSQ